MSLTKLTCPECSTTMRPKAPVAPGKKVKCPKCQTVFVAGADDEDDVEEEKPKPKKKKTPAKAAAAKREPKEEPKPKKKSDDDDEGAYGYIKEEEETEEERERKQIDYGEDDTVRDLRGPAIVKLREPTSWLTLCGFVGAGGWIAFILLMAIPFSFPIPDEKKPDIPEAAPQPGQPAKPAKPKEKSTFHIWWNWDFYEGVINSWDNPAMFWLKLAGFGLGGVYSGLIAFGSIKLINLESRVWGMIAAGMAMLPVNVAGLTFATAFAIQFGLRQGEIDEDSINFVTIGVGVLFWLASLGLGIWVMIMANNSVVKEGFEYEPE